MKKDSTDDIEFKTEQTKNSTQKDNKQIKNNLPENEM